MCQNCHVIVTGFYYISKVGGGELLVETLDKGFHTSVSYLLNNTYFPIQ